MRLEAQEMGLSLQLKGSRESSCYEVRNMEGEKIYISLLKCNMCIIKKLWTKES